MQTSNTFGTFLETIGNLGSSGSEDGKSSSDQIVKLVLIISRQGGEAPIESLAKEAGISKSQLLEAVLQSKSNGLIEIQENDGTTVARLTSFGKALAAA